MSCFQWLIVQVEDVHNTLVWDYIAFYCNAVLNKIELILEILRFGKNYFSSKSQLKWRGDVTALFINYKLKKYINLSLNQWIVVFLFQ